MKKILKLLRKEHWTVVNTKDNPSDIITRGMTPNVLADCALWWHVPEILCLPSEFWPTVELNLEELEAIQN